MKIKILTLILIITVLPAIAADDFYILDIDNTKFPQSETKFYLFEDNKPLNDLSTADFAVYDNASLAEIQNIEIGKVNNNPFSCLISLDMALNQIDIDGYTNREIGIDLAKTLITHIPTNAEIALSSFDFDSYLLSDYSNEKSDALEAIEKTGRSEGSIINSAFISKPAGAFEITKTAKYDNSIVCITDSPINLDKEQIKEYASHTNSKIFLVLIRKKIEENTLEFLKEIGGYGFTINDIEDLESIASTIIAISAENFPSTLTFSCEQNCNNSRLLKFEYLPEPLSVYRTIILEDYEKPTLSSNPPYIGFSNVLPQKQVTKEIELTSRGGNIIISDLSIPSPYFTITSGDISEPIILKNGEKHQISITFSPQDSSIVFSWLEIESNACEGKNIYLTGGFPNTPPKERTIMLTGPLGGETFIAEDTTRVTWTGLLPTDVIQLEYSVDNKRSWDTLAKNQYGLEHIWTLPKVNSDSCYIRAVQLWPNNVGRTMDLEHKKSINTAFFSKDGSKVITSSDDSTAVIWNSNNGKPLITLFGHKREVVFAEFDGSENYAVTASRDSTVILWNAHTGDKIYRFDDFTGTVFAAKFSNNGKYIVASSWDGYVRIFSVQTGELVQKIKTNNGPVRFAVFYKDDYKLYTAGFDGVVRIWDWQKAELIKELDTKFENSFFGNVIYLDFNHNFSKLAATSQSEKTVSVWDLVTSDTLFTVHHVDSVNNRFSINSSSFFVDSDSREFLLTCSVDHSSRLWNANNGSEMPPHIIKEHDNSVQTAVFNFDGTRLLTGSWDNTAKIWNLEQRDLQMDSTDTPFSIKIASVHASDIAFGKVLLGHAVDTTLVDIIRNYTGYPVEIKNMNISGYDAADFILTNDITFPHSLDSMGTQTLELIFSPKGYGERRALLNVIIPGDTLKLKISGTGVGTGIEKIANYIDFGTVPLGDYRDTTLSVIIRNVSDQPIDFDKIEINGVNSDNFVITSGKDITRLNPGQSHDMTIRFLSNNENRNNAQLSFHHTADGSPTQINLFANSKYIEYENVELGIEDISGSPGDVVEIPILFNQKPNNMNTIEKIEFDLSFNSSLLLPLDQYLSSSINHMNRTVKYQVNIEDSSKGNELCRLRFKVALGNDTISTLKLSNISLYGDIKVKLSEKDGNFYLTGYCNDGTGPRLFDSEGRIYLEQNQPNPFSESSVINYEVVEHGHTSIIVTDLLGRKALTLVDEYLTPGAYSTSIDASELTPGVYHYILKTPTQRITRTMQVHK